MTDSPPSLSIPEGTEGPQRDYGPFRSTMGVWLTRQLFIETADTNRNYCIFTLRPIDHEIDGKVYPSLRRVYLEEGDESEYLFSNKYFGGWFHWQKLLNTPWFPEYIEPIRHELKTKLTSEALARIKSRAEQGDYQANKYLLERERLSQREVGRPSNEKIKSEARKISAEQKIFNDDIDRLKEYFG